MTWVRVDDKFPNHPKVGSLAGNRLAAMGLHLEALCFCSTYLTDGVVPGHEVRRYPRRLVEALVTAKLWHRLGDGAIQIHDYLDYNPSRVLVEAKRTEARVRMNNARTSSEHPSRAGATRADASRPVPSRPEPLEVHKAVREDGPSRSHRLVDPLGETA